MCRQAVVIFVPGACCCRGEYPGVGGDVNYMGDYFTDVEVEGDSSVIKEDMSYGAPQGSRQYCFYGTLCVI